MIAAHVARFAALVDAVTGALDKVKANKGPVVVAGIELKEVRAAGGGHAHVHMQRCGAPATRWRGASTPTSVLSGGDTNAHTHNHVDMSRV